MISSLEHFLWFLSIACFFAAVIIRIVSVRPQEVPRGPDGIPAEKKEPGDTLEDLEAQLVKMDNQKKERQREAEEARPLPIGPPTVKTFPTDLREANERKIAENLLRKNVITKDILDKALDHQKKYGGTLTQFLLHFGYIDERKLAQCLSSQFKVPYLPLDAYQISEEIIKSVPVDIAEKYWVLPVDRQGDSLMVVMIDPVDTKAIRELEEATGLNIVPFVGVISEISSALRSYYRNYIRDGGARIARTPTYFIDVKTYTGTERRRTIRYNTKIDISFPVEGRYIKSQTVNVSREGFAFISSEPLAFGTLVTLEVNLPKEHSPLPISAVTQVLRCFPRDNAMFEVGVKTLKISKHEVGIIINYASRHAEI